MQTKKIIAFLILCLLLLCLGSGLLYYFVPIEPIGQQVELIVEPGTTVRAVAKYLRAQHVIPSTKMFLVWVKLHKLERSMQAGKYTFYQNEGIIRAAEKLQNAEPLEECITIIEGLTIEQTAHKVFEAFPIDTVEFVQLCQNQDFIQKLGLSVSSLEGYLFPNTYRFLPDIDASGVITRMVQEFFKAYDALPKTAFSTTYTMHEIVTLASIVEKEAQLVEEQKRIAGVFHNRLRLHMALGADPTVRYILKKFSGPLRVSELKNPSPYNTRIHIGLPPGPICSPGKGALAAAIDPLDTRELFFVAKWDGSGAHDFSVTNAQHDRKKMDIRRQNADRLRQIKKDKK